MKCYLPGLLLVASITSLHAGAPLVVDDSDVNPPHDWEVDLEADGFRDKGSVSEDGVLTVTTGLTPWLEGSLEIGYESERSRHVPGPEEKQDGLTDLELGLKVPLLDANKSPVGLAVSSTVLFPTAAEGLGVDSTNVNLLLIATRNWTPSLSTDLNAGFNWALGSGSGEENASFVGASIRWTVKDPVTLFAETYAWLPAHPEGEAKQILRGGIQVECSKDVLLSAALQTGFGETQQTGVSFGLNWVF